MSTPPKKQGGGLGRLLKDKRALAIGGALLVLLVFYLRSRSATTASASADPNAIDPATGLTYAQEQQAALAAQAAGSGGGGIDTGSGGAVDSGNGPTVDLSAVSAALETTNSALGAIAAEQANEQALIQSSQDAAAQTAQAYNDLTSLGSQVGGVAAQLGGALAEVATANAGALAAVAGDLNRPPAPAPAPQVVLVSAPPPPPSPTPAASSPPPAEHVNTGGSAPLPAPTPPTYGITYGPPAGQRASSNKKQGVYTIH